MKGHLDVVKKLLNEGADPNIKRFGKCALLFAIKYNREDNIALLS